MYILGIETSCDETSAAIIEGSGNNLKLLSNITSTSLLMHGKTGGIIPENAAREQVKFIIPVIQEALKKAFDKNHVVPDLYRGSIDSRFRGNDKLSGFDYLSKIDAIALTYGPGLIGSLLVGVETAKTISMVYNIPLIPVNHMVGHIYANFISVNSKSEIRNPKLNPKPYNLYPDIEFPAIALVVSGGHTDLLLMKNHGDLQLLGGTRDDAAGECFDKCARLLGYSYPGGPKIAELSEKGDPKAFRFPRPMIGSHDFDFSFSGLKTSFFNATKEHFSILRNDIPNSKVGWNQVAEGRHSINDKQKLYDLCASLQEAIVDVLVKKTIKAAKKYNAKSLLISGGVAANQALRDKLSVI
ncbi:MAG TPA: tRNA (adenosine(37)-N6)-threonylcarbamoyltransferase complex transferase subunit TsaD, partial [Xanthomonadales bacterium]|nr:tRNA (adenosine(37)-N6)-threonylcarbamoyltransferase complex transferase subunit TsaD [Xanthomonadales bacterium]